MKVTLKDDIMSCIESIKAISEKVDLISKQAISESDKSEMELAIQMMDLKSFMKQVYNAAVRVNHTIDRYEEAGIIK